MSSATQPRSISTPTAGTAPSTNGERSPAVAYVGLAKRALEIGVAYAKERIQFGVPIGTFQAVQHGFADAGTRVEGAHLLAQRAVWALDTDQSDASRLAGMALLFAAESARFATDRALQYHGGYGFSEEYDIQLYHRMPRRGSSSSAIRRSSTPASPTPNSGP